MTIAEIENLVHPYIEKPIFNFEVNNSIFLQENGRDIYNIIIRENVEQKIGIYLWLNAITNEVLYVGMAGKIKNNGKVGNHSIQKRLLAARGQDKMTKKYVQTNDFISNIMIEKNIKSLKFVIMYSKINEPPPFIESLILYEYYKKHNCLPSLNYTY